MYVCAWFARRLQVLRSLATRFNTHVSVQVPRRVSYPTDIQVAFGIRMFNAWIQGQWKAVL